MSVKIAINGLGRIGRCVIRAICEYARKDVELVAVNATSPVETVAHLLKYDSVHGPFRQEVSHEGDILKVGDLRPRLLSERDPEKLPWAKLGVDIVFECTGNFEKREGAEKHLKAGAKRVLISAPSPDPDATIVFGVNNHMLKKEHKIVSVGSCTTNCLAPVAKVLNDSVGIENGYMTTIHSYTRDQEILDSAHRDLRRARAAGLSMIPTTTGAARALGLVLPELAGKLDGTAVRVPTPNVSMVDFSFIAGRKVTAAEINEIMVKEACGNLKGVLDVCREPLVSIDFNHHPASSIFDATQTKVIGNLCRVASWYDNEWGFSNRMIDVAVLWGER